MSDELKPGEMWFGRACEHGVRPYERTFEDGRHEQGFAAPIDHGLRPGAIGVVELHESVDASRPCVRTIESETRFTMRGPPTVSSNAYRSGWDAVFSRSAVRAN